MNKDTPAIIIGVVVASIAVLAFATYLVFDAIDTGKQLDQVCKDAGYNEHTDMEWNYEKTFKLECDEEYIVTAVRNRRCSKWDKWDKCIKYEGHIDFQSPFLPW